MNDKRDFENEEAKITALCQPYLNKKVTIEFEQTNDWNKTQGVKQGRIIFQESRANCKGKWVFLPKGCRAKGFYLTAGAFDGWYATLVLKTIKDGWITTDNFLKSIYEEKKEEK